jgi:hypothetical protein
MKTSIINKELNYSLHNIENYYKELNIEIYEITNKYYDLILEYLKFIIENIKLNNKKFAKFIVIRGLDTITHVFLNLLLYTKNIDITYFHCQKSFYFYVEFVGQITEDEKKFLQLTSRDASTYVYKKTIFEISLEFKKKNEQMNEITKQKFEKIHSYIYLYRTYIDKIIKNVNYDTNKELLRLFEIIINILNDKKVTNVNIKELKYITDKLFFNIENEILFFNVNIELVKKYIKKPEILNNCEKKIDSPDFITKITNLSNDKFIHWLIN